MNLEYDECRQTHAAAMPQRRLKRLEPSLEQCEYATNTSNQRPLSASTSTNGAPTRIVYRPEDSAVQVNRRSVDSKASIRYETQPEAEQ